MPRSPRFEELGLPFHVIVQGIERCLLFRDDADRRRFIARALLVFGEMGIEVIAWALMGNHVHLILRATNGQLSKAMQRVLGSYAMSFNRRYGRVGRLFRDRFWSRPVRGDDDLWGLIGYVLLNPLRGQLVSSISELRTYRWTSLHELVRPHSGSDTLVDRLSALAPYGNDEASALSALLAMLAHKYVQDPDGAEFAEDEPGGATALSRRSRTDLCAGSTHALILRSDQIEAALRERQSVSAIRQRLRVESWTVDGAIVRAAALCGVAPHCLRGGSRRRSLSRARGLVAHFAGTYLDCTDSDIARRVGIARQSVVAARARGSDLATRLGWTWEFFFRVSVAGHAEVEAAT